MGSDPEAVRRFQSGNVGQGVGVTGPDGKAGVDDQNMAAVGRDLGPGEEKDASLLGVGGQGVIVGPGVVVRDRQGVVAEGGGPVDERPGRIADPVLRVLGRMGVEVDFKPVHGSPRGL